MSNYWKQRIEQEMALKQKFDATIGEEITRLHNHHMAQIEKEIQSFYQRYAVDNEISISEAKKRVSKVDVEAFKEKAKRYVEEKNFSPRANAELALYNLKANVNRLEMLQYNLDLEMLALTNGEHALAEKFLNKEFVDEMNFQAGVLGEFVPSPKTIGNMAQGIINTPYHGAVWSESIWRRQNALRVIVAQMSEQTLLRGKSALSMIPQLRKEFNVSRAHAKRLAVTETARIQTAVQKASYEANGIDEYEFMAEPSACPVCKRLDGKAFKVSDMEAGRNCAPIHPHCHCSSAPAVSRSKSVDDEKQELIEKVRNLDMAIATKDDIIEIGSEINRLYSVTDAIGDNEKLKEIFSDFREIGGVVPEETWSKGTSRVVKAQLEHAFSYYPKEWAEIPKNHGRQLYVRKKKRGYFVEGARDANGRLDLNMPNSRTGYLSIVTDGSKKSTPFHEIGHMVEWANPHVVRIEKEFVNYRTAGEQAVQLRKLFPGVGYSPSEITKPDDFISPYIGKEYKDSAEVLTMGLQGLFVPEEKFLKSLDFKHKKMNIKTIKDDVEFLNLIIGLFVKG